MTCRRCGQTNYQGVRACAACNERLGAARVIVTVAGMPAGFWRRLCSVAIDYALLALLLFASFALQGLLARYGFVSAGTAAAALGITVAGLYYPYYWTSSGQTPGSSMVGIRLVRLNGQPLSLGRALMRCYFSLPLSVACGLLGLLAIAWDPARRGWHDKLSRTIVVRSHGL